jgi:hypothetical protein
MTIDFEWLEPWYAVEDAAVRTGLERQLSREISPRHALFGQSARLIARRSDTDDALFALQEGRVAEVHLTWSKQAECDPRWPVTGIFESLKAWARESMIPLHAELSKLGNRPDDT